jgi:hypothetical protein
MGVMHYALLLPKTRAVAKILGSAICQSRQRRMHPLDLKVGDKPKIGISKLTILKQTFPMK